MEILPIKCINPCAGTVCTTEDQADNKYWYNTIQKSFNEEARESNMVKRYKTERDARARYLANLKIMKEPLPYPRPFNVIQNLNEAHQLLEGYDSFAHENLDDDLSLDEILNPKEVIMEKLENL